MAMASETRYTIDHKIIRKWVEKRHGHPATVKEATGATNADKVDALRIAFPNAAEDDTSNTNDSHEDNGELQEISWDEFFRTFEEQQLAMLYQERTAENDDSRYVRFVPRGMAQAEGNIIPETYA